MPSYTTFTAQFLRDFTTEVFLSYGVPREDAELASGVLSLSDLRGIDSHGVARLHTYCEMLDAGRINPKPNIKIIRERHSIASVDGDNGLGLVVGPKANEIAMDKAAAHGSGWVSVSHTNHFGIAGYYVLEALKRDLIGMAMTNSTKLVAPLWGAERMLGTNPIAMAFPGFEEPPVVIDMATSAVAYGKIEIQNRKNQKLPAGWAIDSAGNLTNEPQAMINGGSMLPLGSTREAGGHKGYCLASMVDVLCCVLSGANWGPFAPPFTLQQDIPDRYVGKGIGHFFGAWDIDGFIDLTEFKKQIDEWIRVFRNTKPQPGQEGVLIPGDPEREAHKEREVNGIPVIDKVVVDLKDVSRMSGVPFEY